MKKRSLGLSLNRQLKNWKKRCETNHIGPGKQSGFKHDAFCLNEGWNSRIGGYIQLFDASSVKRRYPKFVYSLLAEALATRFMYRFTWTLKLYTWGFPAIPTAYVQDVRLKSAEFPSNRLSWRRIACGNGRAGNWQNNSCSLNCPL